LRNDYKRFNFNLFVSQMPGHGRAMRKMTRVVSTADQRMTVWWKWPVGGEYLQEDSRQLRTQVLVRSSPGADTIPVPVSFKL
jgi:hypothetical protein